MGNKKAGKRKWETRKWEMRKWEARKWETRKWEMTKCCRTNINAEHREVERSEDHTRDKLYTPITYQAFSLCPGQRRVPS